MVSEQIPKTAPITVLHVFSGDLWAGAEKMIATLLKQLRKYPDIRILALSLNESTLAGVLRESGIETIVISENNHFFASLLIKTFSHIRGTKVDLIHAHGYKEDMLALLVRQFIGVRWLVSTVHGLPEPSFIRYSNGNNVAFKRKVDYFILKHGFARVVAVSQDMKQNLVNKYGFNSTKVEMIHNGIDIPSLNNPRCPESSDFHIGTVGRLVSVKQYELFLDIADLVTKQVKNVRFSILGDGPLKEELASKVKGLRLDNIVKFEVPRTDPSDFYESIDLYLNTSLHEGLPLSILEAMACGKPVVAPKVGGLPEIITHSEEGFLVESRSPKDFAEWCVKLIRNKELRTTMGQKASKTVSKSFCSDLMADSYHRLYQTLATGMEIQDLNLGPTSAQMKTDR
jgi:glycosyltransferase involved in cell wall biosynthesis